MTNDGSPTMASLNGGTPPGRCHAPALASEGGLLTTSPHINAPGKDARDQRAVPAPLPIESAGPGISVGLSASDPPGTDTVEKIAAGIRRRIAEGVYQPGEVLQRVTFQKEFGAPTWVIDRVMGRLAEEGLLIRRRDQATLHRRTNIHQQDSYQERIFIRFRALQAGGPGCSAAETGKGGGVCLFIRSVRRTADGRRRTYRPGDHRKSAHVHGRGVSTPEPLHEAARPSKPYPRRDVRHTE
ncbi:GntR family transcriptional regulator [Streptomyces sp. NPDC088124]|uniref:GntR family transcriptional regulator n=1 Tax=Streptomyces sp. NPDC088124 TaxID=3154654 RepID=UPI0034260081